MYKFLKPLIDKGFIKRDLDFLKVLPVLIILIFVARGISGFITTYFMGFIGRNVVMHFRRKILKNIMKLPNNFFHQRLSGDLLSKINYDTEQVSDALSHGISSGIRGLFLAIALTYVMLNINFKVTLVLFIIIPFLLFYINIISKKIYFYSKNIQYTMAKVTSLAEEIILGNKIIKLFNGFTFQLKKINRQTYSNCKQEISMIYTFALSVPFMQILGAFSLAILIYLATLEKNHYLGTSMSAGEFTAFFSAAIGMLRPIKQIAIVNSTLQKGIAGANSIFNLIDEISEYNKGILKLKKNKIDINLKNVSLYYKKNNEILYVLKSIMLKVKFGEKIAIIGQSGSGKTTLISTLLCFFKNYEGSIFFNNTPIFNYDLESIRSKISVVSQDVFLFNDTILNNILYGCDKDIKKVDVINSVKISNSLSFIESLPKGFNTLIGKNGINLSGGQKQRLSIVRAILKNTPLIILDEATSSIDIQSEIYIKRSIFHFVKHRSFIIISHRKNIIKDIKSVYILRDGTLARYR